MTKSRAVDTLDFLALIALLAAGYGVLHLMGIDPMAAMRGTWAAYVAWFTGT